MADARNGPKAISAVLALILAVGVVGVVLAPSPARAGTAPVLAPIGDQTIVAPAELSFAATANVSTITLFGLGLAVAILVDAFIVRLTLVPALMVVAGDRNWWAPRRLQSGRHRRTGTPDPIDLRDEIDLRGEVDLREPADDSAPTGR